MSKPAPKHMPLLYKGDWYAVPISFINDKHPGGPDAITKYKNGADCAQGFDAKHSDDARAALLSFDHVLVTYEGRQVKVPAAYLAALHPGGPDAISRNAGNDITETINKYHPPAARDLMKQFVEGTFTKEKANALIAEKKTNEFKSFMGKAILGSIVAATAALLVVVALKPKQ